MLSASESGVRSRVRPPTQHPLAPPLQSERSFPTTKGRTADFSPPRTRSRKAESHYQGLALGSRQPDRPPRPRIAMVLGTGKGAGHAAGTRPLSALPTSWQEGPLTTREPSTQFVGGRPGRTSQPLCGRGWDRGAGSGPPCAGGTRKGCEAFSVSQHLSRREEAWAGQQEGQVLKAGVAGHQVPGSFLASVSPSTSRHRAVTGLAQKRGAELRAG